MNGDNWVQIHHGDSREVLVEMPDNSVDSVVCDPPYELGFMGKAWDSTGIAYDIRLWGEVLRVLKPGGYLLAFGGSRTYHRLACAVEDAGFEIRDQIMWVYGSGFPKSLNVSIAIDKAAGAMEHRGVRFENSGLRRQGEDVPNPTGMAAHKPITPKAQTWQGWGTALKPAHEPIVMARKPLVGTVAANVLAWGTGAINIDGCRVATDDMIPTTTNNNIRGASYGADTGGRERDTTYTPSDQGRWPANFIHDGSDEATAPMGDAARFFYCAKPGKKERNAGLDDIKPRFAPTMNNGIGGKEHDPETATPKHNIHPTVKPLALMRYLIRMVTPPEGTVLDPFAGSGTTLAAAVLEHMNAIGVEMTDDYLPIIEGRVAWAEAEKAQTLL